MVKVLSKIKEYIKTLRSIKIKPTDFGYKVLDYIAIGLIIAGIALAISHYLPGHTDISIHVEETK